MDSRERAAATMSSAVTRARARVTLGLTLALVVAVPAVSFASRPWDVSASSSLLGRRRSFAVSNAVRCDDEYVDASARVKRHSKSQDGEDRYLVDTYFKGLCGGTYLELGALDAFDFQTRICLSLGSDGAVCSSNLIRRVSKRCKRTGRRIACTTSPCATFRVKSTS